ncbi:hypothetical protein [Brevibacillus brevis]|uniref:Uncharacterized protein n=1 Tax=Brevibacillus brevis TaxID=1393 RepID=A0A517IEX4_BREBE|nr:hypothetical protein [Brevibacillus brevis]QDS37378.1 hypothetical protein FPS98_27300 [Brevibacillus brevis]
MPLDLSVDTGDLNLMAIKFGIWSVLMIVALVIVERFIPRILRGIARATVVLGGIYLLALRLS